MMMQDIVAQLLQGLQDSTIDVARMTPYGPDLNEFLRQVTHLEMQLEQLQEYAGELDEQVRRTLAIGALS